MRTETAEVKNRKEAEKAMPWAAVIRKVEGGYRGWESVTDYETWRRQK